MRLAIPTSGAATRSKSMSPALNMRASRSTVFASSRLFPSQRSRTSSTTRFLSDDTSATGLTNSPVVFSLGHLLMSDCATPNPRTYNGNINKLPPALAHLRDQKIWVCWRWFWNGKKWTKPPYRADDPEHYASTSDPATWGTYEQAAAQVRAGKADGFGFALKGCNDIGGVDLDHCRDPGTMAIEPWADDYVRRFPGAYLEATVSGAGLRVLGTSELNFASKFRLKPGNGAAGGVVQQRPTYPS